MCFDVVKHMIEQVKVNNSNEDAVRSYGEIKVVDIEDKDILELDIETLNVRMLKYDIEIIDYYEKGTIKTIRIKKHIDKRNSGEK